MKLSWRILYTGIGFSLVTALSTHCHCPSMSRFEFVDPSIARVLQCPPFSSPTSFITNDMIDFPESANINDLVALAVECDQWTYSTPINGNKLDAYSLSLAQFATDSSNTNNAMISTLLALNALEVAITCATFYRPGTAPLLKDMIAQLPCLGHACRLLLTPDGLNLRNLLWHGFVTDLPRPWLSLVLLLTRQLTMTNELGDDEQQKQKQPTEPKQSSSCFDIGSHPAFKTLLISARSDLLTCPPTLTRDSQPWLPASHHGLYQKLLPWITHRERPVTCCAVLTMLLEHGLRLDWCCANHRPDDSIAQPRVFYVTLDGHGQRQQHDLLLHPYVGNNNTTKTRNDLLTIIPASTIALLTDLFCSSCGGPNIRSVLSHGLWDDYLIQEWIHKYDKNADGIIHQEEMYWDVVRLLLLAMDSVASRSPLPISYQPTFSYTAVTQKAIRDCQNNLHQLIALPNVNPAYITLASLAQDLLVGSIPNVPNELMELQSERMLLPIKIPFWEQTMVFDTDTCWTTEGIFEEHRWNMELSRMGLTQTLLHDIAMASQQLQQDVLMALEQYPTTNTRTRKGYLRLIYSSLSMALHLYILTFNIAILSLHKQDQHCLNYNDDDNETMLLLQKALQRSRMVVSTTRTFLRSNVDRARKAIVEYTQSKAIRHVVKLFEP